MSNTAMNVLRLSVAALVLSAGTVSAQEEKEGPGHRQGFWASLGGGYAVARTVCSLCPEDPPYRNRFGAYLQLGGVASRHLLVAGEVFTESNSTTDSTTRVTHWTATAHWYPWSPPVYIRFGLGLSRGRYNFEVNGVESNEKVSGLGILIGTGADIRLSQKFSLSPIASWYMAAVGDLDTAQGRATSVSANTWFVGLGLTLN